MDVRSGQWRRVTEGRQKSICTREGTNRLLPKYHIDYPNMAILSTFFCVQLS